MHIISVEVRVRNGDDFFNGNSLLVGAVIVGWLVLLQSIGTATIKKVDLDSL